MGVRAAVAALAGALLLGGLGPSARADKDREALPGGVAVDWAAGTVEAAGSAAADLRAPSAEVGRVKAERQARERAAARISEALRGLGKGRWEEAPPGAEALDKALAGAEVADVSYGASGSVSLRLRLKLAALPTPLLPAGRRQAQKAPRPRGESKGAEGRGGDNKGGDSKGGDNKGADAKGKEAP